MKAYRSSGCRVLHSSLYHLFMGQDPTLGEMEVERAEWGKDLSVASQMVVERQVYLVEAESSKENWVFDGSILRRVEEKMSGSPSSNRKVVRGGPRGEGCGGRGRSNQREKEVSA